MKRKHDEDDDTCSQEKLDAEAEQLIKEKIADDMYGAGGVEPDPEDLLYD